jgi:cell division FtsZ-interacting protein ZapD
VGRLSVAAALGHAALATRRNWHALPQADRSRLQALLRQATSAPASLSAADRQELKELVTALRLGEVVREAAPRAVGRRGGRFPRRF